MSNPMVGPAAVACAGDVINSAAAVASLDMTCQQLQDAESTNRSFVTTTKVAVIPSPECTTQSNAQNHGATTEIMNKFSLDAKLSRD